MPLGSELSATANVCQHINATAFEPRRANGWRVVWQHRDLKTTVAVKQCRVFPIEFEPFATDLKIRNASPVLRSGFELLNLQPIGIEKRGEALEFLPAGLAGYTEVKRRWCHEILNRHEVIV